MTQPRPRAYNAAMGNLNAGPGQAGLGAQRPGPTGWDAGRIDAWLRGGGRVVTASERAARALTNAFHRACRVEGLAAWPAPQIQDWNSFVREAWDQAAGDDRLVLNPLQEQTLWTEIVRASGQGSALLEAPRQRMAALAMDAHRLLCQYAPQFLNATARSPWQQDAAAFSAWLSEFESVCRSHRLISAARVPLELLPALSPDSANRPPLLLAGFDRILPVQRRVFSAWGESIEARGDRTARAVEFYEAADAQSELNACAFWCCRRLAADPHARLLVITQDLGRRRGEIERAFLRFVGDGSRFEFSLGVPLGSIALGRGALLILRWLGNSLEEQEVDWLFSTGQATADVAETFALTGFMRGLRRRGLERPRWRLEEFISESRAELTAAWVSRFLEARRRLQEYERRPQSPLAWAELVPQLLQTVGWPGARPLASAEFQALRRWQQTLDACASLGFDGRHVNWSEFFSVLERALGETLFVPESVDASIQIAGPAESAGLAAGAIWFMGASEDAWPSAGTIHPLLPFEVQRDADMPHSRPQLDWDLARAITTRLLGSACEAHFSYARQSAGVEMRPSRLVMQLAGAPQPMPEDLAPPPPDEPVTVPFEDRTRVPFPSADVAGGATVLTSQSQCPFKAFATARLGAQGWEPAQAGLTAAQRGKLLHAVLHSVWKGPPAGIRSHQQLGAIADLTGFVDTHVRNVFPRALPAGASERMPQRYLELEETRLVSLITQWLEFERARAPFTVTETEFDVERSIAGLSLNLRIDRIDRLNDETLLVVDYKSGNIAPSVWDLPRPDDVQLPLYAGFALDREIQPLGGLVFAKVRAGEHGFAGKVGDARATLQPGLGPQTYLVKKPLLLDDLEGWRQTIEQLARDFIVGRAETDPREYPKTCERCNLPVLCRVYENRSAAGDGDEEAQDE